jgi:hypothetical protein
MVTKLLSYMGSARGQGHLLTADEPLDDVLTHRFHMFLPLQIPCYFIISPLPRDILSWVMLLLQTAGSSLIPDRKMPTKSLTGYGGSGGGHSA